MSGIVISPMKGADREWAARLFAQSDPWRRLGITIERCRELCDDSGYRGFVARVRRRRCGAIILQEQGVAGAPYIKSVVVAEPERGSGIGAAMVGFAEDLFRPRARHIFLCVSSFNRRARSFYQRLGYRQVGEFPDYIVEGESEVLMHKRLG